MDNKILASLSQRRRWKSKVVQIRRSWFSETWDLGVAVAKLFLLWDSFQYLYSPLTSTPTNTSAPCGPEASVLPKPQASPVDSLVLDLMTTCLLYTSDAADDWLVV